MQFPRVFVAPALFTAVLILGCRQDHESAPTAPPSPQLSILDAPECDPTAAQQAAVRYFETQEDEQEAVQKLGAAGTLCVLIETLEGDPDLTPDELDQLLQAHQTQHREVFDVFALMAQARRAGTSTLDEDVLPGVRLALALAEYVQDEVGLADPQSFPFDEYLALPSGSQASGIFELVDATTNTAATTLPHAGQPLWTADPQGQMWSSFVHPTAPDVPVSRFLILARPKDAPDGGFTATPVFPLGGVYEFRSVPELTFTDGSGAPALVIGVCPAVQGTVIGHQGLILPFARPSCPASQDALAPSDEESGSSWALAGRVAGRLAQAFGPAPLWAAAAIQQGGGSGSRTGSFSDFAAQRCGTITLSFTSYPADGQIKVPLTPTPAVQFLCERAPGAGVTIGLESYTNRGEQVSWQNGAKTLSELTSGAAPVGVATFENASLNKTGGYRLRGFVQQFADGSYTPAEVVGGLFNLKK